MPSFIAAPGPGASPHGAPSTSADDGTRSSAAEPTLRLPLPGGDTPGSSFDRDLRDILWRRSRALFGLGVAVSAAVIVVWQLLLPPASLTPGIGALRLGYLLSFGAGLAYLQFRRPSRRGIQAATATVVAFNLLLTAVVTNLVDPSREQYLAFALLLFVHAAFIPARTTHAWLAGLATVAVPITWLLTHEAVPVVAAFWAAQEPGAFWAHLGRISVGTAILAGVSVIVSRTLYDLQRTAHRAQRLGNYILEREIGAGGMGNVYLGRHALICRPTAVKVLRSGDLDTSTARGRFEREVRLSAALTHPNTITVFDYGFTGDGVFYYAMEYLHGMDLQRMVERFGPLSASRVVHVLTQACGSLAEAHGLGVVHRDIKPSNVFLTHRGGICDFVKLLDFGLARGERADRDDGRPSDLTRTGMMFGTPRYIAPEAVDGMDRLDARSDVYSLGAVAFWMLTGRPLFEEASSVRLLVDHIHTRPPRPSSVSELPIPPELDDIVLRCLEKKPEDRFGCVLELEEALARVPLAEPWSRDRAREWWTLHMPEAMKAPDCFDESNEAAGNRPGAQAAAEPRARRPCGGASASEPGRPAPAAERPTPRFT